MSSQTSSESALHVLDGGGEVDPASSRIRNFPRLTLFYGIGPLELSQTPRNILAYYEQQLPILQAEKRLLTLAAQDWSHQSKGFRTQVHRELKEQAGWDDAPTVHPVADANKLGGIGIKVVREAPSPPAEVEE